MKIRYLNEAYQEFFDICFKGVDIDHNVECHLRRAFFAGASAYAIHASQSCRELDIRKSMATIDSMHQELEDFSSHVMRGEA